LVAYAFVAFQYDVSFIRSSAVFAGFLSGTAYSAGFSLGDLVQFAIIFVPFGFGTLFVARELVPADWSDGVFFTLASIIVFGVIVLPKQLLNISLAPQPIRYVPELDISISLLIGFLAPLVIQFIADITAEAPRSQMAVKSFLTALLLIALIFNASITYLPFAVAETTPSPSIANVPEAVIAQWLADHVTDQRVFATGTICFWLDAFSNVSEIRGGSDQGASNIWWANVTSEMNTGSDPELSILWAEAWNVKYIVVIFPNASTAYHDYTYPNKFQGILALPYYYNGFGIYEVPLSHPQLVEAVSARSAQTLLPITGVKDRRDLSAYVNLIGAPNTDANVTYIIDDPDEISVSVVGATTDTALIVKMTYDPAWGASLYGQPVAVSSIGPGFMILYPGRSGSYQMTLQFNRSNGLITGIGIGIAILVALALGPSILASVPKRQKKVSSTRRSSQPRTSPKT